jgi:hypothetical protein
MLSSFASLLEVHFVTEHYLFISHLLVVVIRVPKIPKGMMEGQAEGVEEAEEGVLVDRTILAESVSRPPVDLAHEVRRALGSIH